MKIQYKYEDLLNCEEGIIAHGCNAQGVMSAGVAKGIKAKYPEAYKVYRNKFDNGELKLGEIILVTAKDKLIINAITQERYGRDRNVVYCSYPAIRSCMRQINEIMQSKWAYTNYGSVVAMPKIGSGLANGDWSTIEAIIEQESVYFQPIVYVL